jgi:hypothetical protein
MMILLSSFVASENSYNWGWSVGDIGIFYDTKIGGFYSDSHLINMNIIIANRININTSILSAQLSSPNDRYSAFLPVEIGFIPLWLTDTFYLSLYGRGEWQLQTPAFLEVSTENNRLYGATGIRLSLFKPDNKFHYSMASSLFIEYSTTNELRIGIKLDAALFVGVIADVTIGISKGKYNDHIEDQRREGYIPTDSMGFP